MIEGYYFIDGVKQNKIVIINPIKVYSNKFSQIGREYTQLFTDHLKERMFYIDVDRWLKEFLPATRTFTTPTDYKTLKINVKDVPIALLSDGSLLVSYKNYKGVIDGYKAISRNETDSLIRTEHSGELPVDPEPEPEPDPEPEPEPVEPPIETTVKPKTQTIQLFNDPLNTNLNKLDIGKSIELKKNPESREWFTVQEDISNIIGLKEPVFGYPMEKIDFPNITVHETTGLFLDHTGTRTFYIDTNRLLQEFLPATRTTTTPIDYEAIEIEDGDTPLMLLSDGSMLITESPYTHIKAITSTTRGSEQTLTVDGSSIDKIRSFNYVNDKASITTGNANIIGKYGVIELNGVIPTNLITERSFSGANYFYQNFTSIKDDQTIFMRNERYNSYGEFQIYENVIDGGAIDVNIDNNNLYQVLGLGSLFVVPENPAPFKAILRSIFTSPEIVQFLPSTGGSIFNQVFTAGYQVITLTTTSQSYVLSGVGITTFTIKGRKYSVQSVEAIGTRETFITLIHNKSDA